MDTNVLYYGDNLEILRKYIPDESIDLIYLDPPFNSKATYNILYKELTGNPSKAQIMAFEDTWQWGIESEAALSDIATSGLAPQATKELMSVLPNFVGKKTPMRAYLTMMCVRLIELRRILKNTGSLYLHCDPTASHYLKILLDSIFGIENYRNELVWKRQSAHSDSRGYGSVHDIVLFYVKSDAFIWNQTYQKYDEDYIEQYYRYIDADGRKFMSGDLGAAGLQGGGYEYEWKGIKRIWRVPIQSMERLDSEGKIFYTKNGIPRIKRYLDESKGMPVQDLWSDLEPLRSWHKERIGYPTQKPMSLLNRVILSSSNEGDIVLDPFCGCGTAVVSAQHLNRKWIGIDITYLAISTMKWRLDNMFSGIEYKVVGEPVDLEGAIALSKQDKYQFQWWAISLIKYAQPYGDKKKGADSGIDGYLYFQDEKDKIKKAIISVKGGHVNVSQIRDLIGVVKREKAEMGIFITLEPYTKPMEQEAILEGFYCSPLGKEYQKIQILTIADLLNRKKPDTPSWVAPMDTPPSPKKKSETLKML
ncbi:MAG: DNA methyltransferase [Dehalococcoidales bacterium]|nr:DNA methyltransferase [Dehalococcoidales bacterium]